MDSVRCIEQLGPRQRITQKPFECIILSNPLRETVHFIERRPFECEGEECWPCRQGFPKKERWHFRVRGKRSAERRITVSDDVGTWLCEHGPIGLRVRLWKDGPNWNDAIEVESLGSVFTVVDCET